MRRFVDLIVSALGLFFLIPVFLAVSVLIWVQNGRPVFFWQVRIGLNGKPFDLCKFRTMSEGPGRLITQGQDPRITPLGRWLRRYKVDELPQLWNVFRGEMSLIGPRPEVAPYVDAADPLWQRVLLERPGITGFASLLYRREEELLAASADPELLYRQMILPDKLKLSVEYLDKRSWLTDCRLLWWTVRSSWLAAQPEAALLRRLLIGDSPQ